MPQRRQYTPKKASSAMTRQSHHSASSMPPATGGPSTAAMTGLNNSRRVGPSGPRGAGAALVPKASPSMISASKRSVGEGRRVFQVPPGAERTALTLEHGGEGGGLAVERLERLDQGIRAVRVHGVAGFYAAVDRGPDRTGLLHPNRHRFLPNATLLILDKAAALFLRRQAPVAAPAETDQQTRSALVGFRMVSLEGGRRADIVRPAR